VEPDNGGLVRALWPHHMRPPVLEWPPRTRRDGAAAAEAHPANNRRASTPPPRYNGRQRCNPNNDGDDYSSRPTPAEQIKATRCARAYEGAAAGAWGSGKGGFGRRKGGRLLGGGGGRPVWWVQESTGDRSAGGRHHCAAPHERVVAVAGGQARATDGTVNWQHGFGKAVARFGPNARNWQVIMTTCIQLHRLGQLLAKSFSLSFYLTFTAFFYGKLHRFHILRV